MDGGVRRLTGGAARSSLGLDSFWLNVGTRFTEAPLPDLAEIRGRRPSAETFARSRLFRDRALSARSMRAEASGEGTPS